MNSYKTIGGYFGLELNKSSFAYSDAVLLNSARNCLLYILRANNVKKIYLPKFNCDVVLDAVKQAKVPYELYSIDMNLEIGGDFKLLEGEYIIYVNYFGIKDKYCKFLTNKYGRNLIIDCSQAYYFEPNKIAHIFYSPRKFFGVPDGGILYTDKMLTDNFIKDTSFQRFSHLLKRIDLSPEDGYEDFKIDDNSLSNQPIKEMSRLTKHILDSINSERARKIRVKNFNYLNKYLGKQNELIIDKSINGPLCYPYFTSNQNLREKLIENKIFVATYWPNVFDWASEDDVEYKLAKSVIPLPIDQRYNISDMRIILKVING